MIYIEKIGKTENYKFTFLELKITIVVSGAGVALFVWSWLRDLGLPEPETPTKVAAQQHWLTSKLGQYSPLKWAY